MTEKSVKKIVQNLFDEADDVLCALKSGAITVEDARARSGLLKVKAKQIEMELDHAKHTQRLVAGSNKLPGFVRVA